VPKGPLGERRPADMIGCAVTVARLYVGIGSEELREPSGKVRSGQAGAKARSGKLTAEERQTIGRKATAARWK
jgi:hypothetical protein